MYTDLRMVINDIALYLSAVKGEPLSLSLFPQLARVRWPWIVSNWNITIYPLLDDLTQGDDYLRNLLGNMKNDVITVSLGAKYNPFDDYAKSTAYAELIDMIAMNTIPLTPDEQVIIRDELTRASRFSLSTFEEMAAILRSKVDAIEQEVNMSDEDAIAALGTPTLPNMRSYTNVDLYDMSDLLDLADFVDSIIYELKQEINKAPNLLSAANSNIDPDSNVAFRTDYMSTIAVMFEQSLEYMADKYLGSRNRWFELVTINNLQAPYEDVSGAKEYLKASGQGTVLRIADTHKHKIPIGTRIRLGSARYPAEEVRYINTFIDNNDGTLTITVSGDPDLNKYKVSEMAYVRIFEPHTVNEMSIILIPQSVASTLPTAPEPNSDALKQLDKSLLNFGVDVKRDETTGDFILNSDGDFAKSYGLPGVRQALLYKLKTTQGENLWHKRYGVPGVVGDAWLGTQDEANQFAEIVQQSIMQDTRFEEVTLKNIKLTPNSIALDFVAKIAGFNELIPLSFVG